MGLPKLWGNAPDGSGHGFVYSHVKSIYYNWAQKKLLSTKLDEMDTTANNIQDHQIAYIFTEEYPYVTGEYTIYNERLYRFVADKEAGAWDSSKVQETVAGNDLYDKFDTSKIIASTNITQNGYVMDGKTCADALAQLNSNITGINTKLRTRTINSGTLLNAALNLQGNGILFFSSDHTPNDVPQSVSEAFAIIIKEHNSSRMHVVLYPYSSSDTNIYTRSIYNSNWLDVWHANE